MKIAPEDPSEIMQLMLLAEVIRIVFQLASTSKVAALAVPQSLQFSSVQFHIISCCKIFYIVWLGHPEVIFSLWANQHPPVENASDDLFIISVYAYVVYLRCFFPLNNDYFLSLSCFRAYGLLSIPFL